MIADELRRLLRAKGWTPAQLARALKVNSGFMTLVLAGKRRVPPTEAPAWADALELQGSERTAFLIEAIGDSPLLRELDLLWKQTEQDEKRITDLLRRLEALERKETKRR